MKPSGIEFTCACDTLWELMAREGEATECNDCGLEFCVTQTEAGKSGDFDFITVEITAWPKEPS